MKKHNENELFITNQALKTINLGKNVFGKVVVTPRSETTDSKDILWMETNNISLLESDIFSAILCSAKTANTIDIKSATTPIVIVDDNILWVIQTWHLCYQFYYLLDIFHFRFKFSSFNK